MLNGEKPEQKPEEKVVGLEEVKTFLQRHFTEISQTLPDFKFTVIGHNISQPGHDIVMSEDDPNWVLNFIDNAIKHLAAVANPN